MEGGLFGLLCHDMKTYLVQKLTLKCKRAMLCVSKWCYWWMKKHTFIKAVAHSTGSCVIECEYGHRTRCTVADQRITTCIMPGCVYNEFEAGKPQKPVIAVRQVDQNVIRIGKRGTLFIGN